MPRTLRLAPDWRATLLLRKDLPAGTLALAPFLIGKLLIHTSPGGIAGGRIVETEAYPPGDAAGHGYRGLTRSNRSLFLDHGHVYIYRAYGSAWMLNFSSEKTGVGAGVLIRAIEPLVGLEIMRTRRPRAKPRDLARGPGRLAAALGIDLAIDGRVSAPAGRSFWRTTASRRTSAAAFASASAATPSRDGATSSTVARSSAAPAA